LFSTVLELHIQTTSHLDTCLKLFKVISEGSMWPVVRSLLNAALCRSYLSWLFHSTVRAPVTFCDRLNVIQDVPFSLFFYNYNPQNCQFFNGFDGVEMFYQNVY